MLKRQKKKRKKLNLINLALIKMRAPIKMRVMMMLLAMRKLKKKALAKGQIVREKIARGSKLLLQLLRL